MKFQVKDFPFDENETHKCIIITRGDYDYYVTLYYNLLFSFYKQCKNISAYMFVSNNFNSSCSTWLLLYKTNMTVCIIGCLINVYTVLINVK